MAVNAQTLQGNWNEIKGKLRERWAELSGNELDMARANVDQLVGAIQKKTGENRESVEQFLDEITNHGASLAGKAAETVRQYAQNAAETVQETVAQGAESVKAGYEKTEQLVQRHPVESLAVCFGAGLITGVVIGLMARSH
jgi:uncharacterized protein YjbJ (UPF0337 family)